jgi:MerR family Zn(II)-responsive transcriptional regulator of zntA
MIVNQLARAAGVEPHVVRYYARIGLLQPRRNPENGYQQFSPNDLQRLSFARQAQSIGFTLSDIAALLNEGPCSGPEGCERMRRILRRRMEENQRKLRELASLRRRMQEAYALWGKAGACPALHGGPCPAVPQGAPVPLTCD